MNIEQIFQDKTVKAKPRVFRIGEWLINKELTFAELLNFADKQKPSVKATCIEAAEYATKNNPGIATGSLWQFATAALKNDEPRVK